MSALRRCTRALAGLVAFLYFWVIRPPPNPLGGWHFSSKPKQHPDEAAKPTNGPPPSTPPSTKLPKTMTDDTAIINPNELHIMDHPEEPDANTEKHDAIVVTTVFVGDPNRPCETSEDCPVKTTSTSTTTVSTCGVRTGFPYFSQPTALQPLHSFPSSADKESADNPTITTTTETRASNEALTTVSNPSATTGSSEPVNKSFSGSDPAADEPTPVVIIATDEPAAVQNVDPVALPPTALVPATVKSSSDSAASQNLPGSSGSHPHLSGKGANDKDETSVGIVASSPPHVASAPTTASISHGVAGAESTGNRGKAGTEARMLSTATQVKDMDLPVTGSQTLTASCQTSQDRCCCCEPITLTVTTTKRRSFTLTNQIIERYYLPLTTTTTVPVETNHPSNDLSAPNKGFKCALMIPDEVPFTHAYGGYSGAASDSSVRVTTGDNNIRVTGGSNKVDSSPSSNSSSSSMAVAVGISAASAAVTWLVTYGVVGESLKLSSQVCVGTKATS
ncbi:hypothetical protein BJ508DRAFT_53541 [Ascobolus immersus RN42]|uniref:Uncharacterized protein n=1 Tax=Ascobolus immersus RN42 TaxID=1160509 RepID=A0A3N4HIQ1_ASCIM|nr:hypothetical protein BJ508DRAFT_53541 [Ascobolus immersus RN42]